MYNKDEIIGALKACRGLIYIAAKRIGCSPQTIYNHIEKHPEIREIIDNLRQEPVDKAEVKLEAAVDKGQPWAIKYLLSTQGKKRGYVQREEKELTGAEGAPIQFIINEVTERPAKDGGGNPEDSGN